MLDSVKIKSRYFTKCIVNESVIIIMILYVLFTCQLLYPPQTKFGGVYRNHPVRPSVRPSVHVPCKRNFS